MDAEEARTIGARLRHVRNSRKKSPTNTSESMQLAGTLALCRSVVASADSLLHVRGAVLPFATVRYGTVSALPARRPGVLLVVSRTVAAEVARPDLVFPDLEIRDEHHRVIGCQRLARFDLT